MGHFHRIDLFILFVAKGYCLLGLFINSIALRKRSKHSSLPMTTMVSTIGAPIYRVILNQYALSFSSLPDIQ